MNNQNSLGMTFLRAWMWFVPITMLLVAVGLAVYAAVDGQWPLFGIMCFMAVFALCLLVLHYWILYRFGKDASQ
jgi:Na+-driven multidrug efflux pump